MKTKKLTTLLACVLIAMTAYSQKTYLKITKSNKADDYEMYPPDTKFELKTKEGYIIFKNSDDPGSIEIKEKYTLYVYPSWKDDTDIFVLTEGKVEKILTSSDSKSDHNKAYSMQSNGVAAHFKVTDSKVLDGKKNLEFRLSNGISFQYNDGKYLAYLNKKENYLNIESKYLITSELGTLKLSFNPNNGVVWWVFEKNKNINDLVGEWIIDLRPTPSSTEYLQTLKIEKITNNLIEGMFYGSELKDGFLNTNWEKPYFSFSTSDASNNYYHSGYILNGELYGISYCPKRKLVTPWSGKLKN
jgi:hypothetical protein